MTHTFYDEALDRLLLAHHKKTGSWPAQIKINRAEARALIKEIDDPDFEECYADEIKAWLDGDSTPFYATALAPPPVGWSPAIPVVVKQ